MKKYITGITAFVIAIAGSAFTAKKAHHVIPGKAAGPFYYEYKLSVTTGDHIPSNYTYLDPQPSDPDEVDGCGGAGVPCVVLATGTSGMSGVPDTTPIDASHLAGNTKAEKDPQ